MTCTLSEYEYYPMHSAQSDKKKLSEDDREMPQSRSTVFPRLLGVGMCVCVCVCVWGGGGGGDVRD